MELDWKLNNKSNIGFQLCSTTSRLIGDLSRDQFSDLADMFPMQNAPECHYLIRDGYIIYTMQNRYGSSFVMSCGTMKENQVAKLVPLIEPYAYKSHEELYKILGQEWFSFDKFIYVGPCDDNTISWADIQKHIVDWLNNCVLSSIFDNNRRRVLRAIPEPPKFDINKVNNSLWVLECEETCKQGTAVAIANIGLVTCSHVIGSNTKAFHISNINKKYKINVIKRNETLDLAVISLVEFDDELLYIEKASSDDIAQMDHIGIAGFPNYRLGDSGVLIPGLVVGFRPRSGVQRILTNAPIVAGNSGGPVINGDNQVIGIAVTGADKMEDAHQTEEHGIIPINALNLLY